MKSITTILLAIVAGIAQVNAHGYVKTVALNGVEQSGWLPFTDPYETPVPQRLVRRVMNDSPITDIHSTALSCNVNGEDPAGATPEINAGDSIKFTWNTWPPDHLGPVTVYLASCGSAGCASLPSSQARWFPIDKRGLSPSLVWASAQLITDGISFTSTIPSSLAPGEYLARVEIVALHSIGAPQFYPSCSQIRVTGSGTDKPSESDLVNIPGLYDGHVFPNVWANPTSYAVAGPAIPAWAASANAGADAGAGSGSGNAPPPTSDSTTTAAVPPASDTPAPETPSSSPAGDAPLPTATGKSMCKLSLKKRAAMRKRAPAAVAMHRRMSKRWTGSF